MDSSSSAGDLSPGDIEANVNFLTNKMLKEIYDVFQKPDNYRASKIIRMVPESPEDHGKKLYEPKAVAIGPYHRKEEDNNYTITREHKLWCVQRKIGDNYKQDLGKILRKMKEREEDALKFYREHYGKDSGMDSQSFLEMLMLDSCFILIALLFDYDMGKITRSIEDPIVQFSHPRWVGLDLLRASAAFKIDLLLLNNQIPFFILEDVFNDIYCLQEKMRKGGDEDNRPMIRNAALCFFPELGLRGNGLKDTKNRRVHHLLHLYHMYLEPPMRPGEGFGGDFFLQIDPERSLPSATELQRKSAVNFKVKKWVYPPESVLDVTTSKSGDIEMPTLRLYDHTTILLHNLIRFEQSDLDDVEPYITAYVAFMDHIVRKEEDVELLDNRRVLENRLNSDAEVVFLFRQLHNVIDHSKSPGYLAKVYQDVRRCRDSKRRRAYADAKQRYCSNVWLSISFVGGVILAVLTLIQTIYTILTFYQS